MISFKDVFKGAWNWFKKNVLKIKPEITVASGSAKHSTGTSGGSGLDDKGLKVEEKPIVDNKTNNNVGTNRGGHGVPSLTNPHIQDSKASLVNLDPNVNSSLRKSGTTDPNLEFSISNTVNPPVPPSPPPSHNNLTSNTVNPHAPPPPPPPLLPPTQQVSGKIGKPNVQAPDRNALLSSLNTENPMASLKKVVNPEQQNGASIVAQPNNSTQVTNGNKQPAGAAKVGLGNFDVAAAKADLGSSGVKKDQRPKTLEELEVLRKAAAERMEAAKAKRAAEASEIKKASSESDLSKASNNSAVRQNSAPTESSVDTSAPISFADRKKMVAGIVGNENQKPTPKTNNVFNKNGNNVNANRVAPNASLSKTQAPLVDIKPGVTPAPPPPPPMFGVVSGNNINNGAMIVPPPPPPPPMEIFANKGFSGGMKPHGTYVASEEAKQSDTNRRGSQIG